MISRRAGAWTLGITALVLAALGAISTAAMNSELESSKRNLHRLADAKDQELEGAKDAARARDAATAVDREFRRAVAALVGLEEAASTAWLEETSGPGATTAERRKEEAAAWSRIRGLVAGAMTLPGARVAVYAEPADVLGWTSAEGGGGTDGAAWADRAPESLIRAEFARLSDDRLGPSTPLAWFTEEKDGGARLHVAEGYEHGYEDPGGRDATVTRIVEVSARFPVARFDFGLQIRYDVAGGRTVSVPVPTFGDEPMSGQEGVVDALFPDDVGVRFAAGTATPRARLAVQTIGSTRTISSRGGPVFSPYLYWIVSLFLLVGTWMLALGKPRPEAEPAITAEAAHELKTPLTAMRGTLEVALRRERTPEEYRETIVGCLEEVKGLQNLVTQVLFLTRGASAPRADEAVDVAALVRAEVERVRGTAKEREVSLEAPEGAVTVRGDPSLLARAVGNLLDNAALHSVAGGAIRTSLAVERGSVVLAVEDDGPGIPASRREKVFERFWRGPEVGRRGIPGAGLGLPIARWVAGAHGGRLDIDPAVEGRARFVMRLPVADRSTRAMA